MPLKLLIINIKMKIQQIENKKDFQEDEREPKGTLEDDDDEIKSIKKSKSKK